MKKLIFSLLLLTIYSYAQVPVSVTQYNFGTELIYSDAGDLKQFIGSDTTLAFPIRNSNGARTLIAKHKAVGAGGAGYLTLSLQLYYAFLDNDTNPNNGSNGWIEYYSGTAMDASLDTVARSIVNSVNDTTYYIPMSKYFQAQFSPADYGRLYFNLSEASDTASAAFYISGQ